MDQTRPSAPRSTTSSDPDHLVLLVVLVVFVFLRERRGHLHPSVAVPVSLIGTFGVMYLLGYSLDNLSLMALTISTGFVVDDAIVVIENITRYLERAWARLRRRSRARKEIGFTVFSMSVLARRRVHPDPADGRHRRPPVPRVRGHALGGHPRPWSSRSRHADDVRPPPRGTDHGALPASERAFKRVLGGYGIGSRSWVLRHSVHHPLRAAMATLGLNIYLFIIVPKGFFPQQDTGRLSGQILADQDISFQAMNKIQLPMVNIVAADPAVDTVNGFTGGGRGGSTTNTGSMFISLKPLAQRKISADQVINRLRPSSQRSGRHALPAGQPGYPRSAAASAAQYQYTMRGDNLTI
jgi:multidrug efflux pump subunit AcrB